MYIGAPDGGSGKMRFGLKAFAWATASIFILGQYHPGWAFKNPLRDMLQQDQPASTQSAMPKDAATKPVASNNGVIQYANSKFHYTVEVPGNWQQMSGDAKSNSALFADTQGPKGGFTVNANWMAEDFPVHASLQAMEKQYKERLKHGELAKYYRKDVIVKDKAGKNIALFQGYVTIESIDDPDPDIQRMQWIGYGKGNYYNFTWSSKPDPFQAYLPQFEQIMDKIQFSK